MCGLIGMIAAQGNDISPFLLEGLGRMNYRGYDSAGIATLIQGALKVRRQKGRLAVLKENLAQQPLTGSVGIGHTRWATHGKVSNHNAHPHSCEGVAIVHNGIIENAFALKKWLKEQGATHPFLSETDSEVIAHLIAFFKAQGMSFREAFRTCLGHLEGAYAIAALCQDTPDVILGARQASPLAIGYGKNVMAFASDAGAFAPTIDKICYLEDGQWASLAWDKVQIFADKGEIKSPPITARIKDEAVDKKGYKHFMLKEIFEQPLALRETFAFCQKNDQKFAWGDVARLMIVGCGTAYHAGLAAAIFFEELAHLPTQCEVASEFRYRHWAMRDDVMGVLISQSGETADTLAAMRKMSASNISLLAIVNEAHSTMAREASHILATKAGREIGVASTKAFTTQLMALFYLILQVALHRRGDEFKKDHELLMNELKQSASLIERLLTKDDSIKKIAHIIYQASYVLYVGRGAHGVMAHEGALKLKEISYIHAEAYPAGELKHGPLALIEEGVPVIVIAPDDDLFAKTLSNMEEIRARGGHIILLTDEAGAQKARHIADTCHIVPQVHPFIAPLIYAVPIQRIAYETAVLLKKDIDCPRNLAKSVTVE